MGGITVSVHRFGQVSAASRRPDPAMRTKAARTTLIYFDRLRSNSQIFYGSLRQGYSGKLSPDRMIVSARTCARGTIEPSSTYSPGLWVREPMGRAAAGEYISDIRPKCAPAWRRAPFNFRYGSKSGLFENGRSLRFLAFNRRGIATLHFRFRGRGLNRSTQHFNRD